MGLLRVPQCEYSEYPNGVKCEVVCPWVATNAQYETTEGVCVCGGGGAQGSGATVSTHLAPLGVCLSLAVRHGNGRPRWTRLQRECEYSEYPNGRTYSTLLGAPRVPQV